MFCCSPRSTRTFVLQPAFFVKVENLFAVLELTFEVGVDVVGQFRGDHRLAIVIPIGVDAHQELGLIPFDGVAM